MSILAIMFVKLFNSECSVNWSNRKIAKAKNEFFFQLERQQKTCV